MCHEDECIKIAMKLFQLRRTVEHPGEIRKQINSNGSELA